MEAENFMIKDPEILLEKLTALTSDFSKLAKDREMKEIFTQIEKLKSGLSKGRVWSLGLRTAVKTSKIDFFF